jgi:predicted PurR-regulated permease PerM
LAQKENLEKQCKGLLYAFVKEKTADRIIRACGMADQTFSNFITGQCLEACILGFMFFIAMHIFSIPYALTISVTIAVTALIPVFGAFVGCGVGAFLILVEDPKKVIVFLILFIVLQQIEGNLIYPHVVGGSVGLPSIWVLAAVVLGGNVMGVIGMLVFVPLFSVIYALLKEFVLVRLKERNIPWSKYGEKMPITGTAGTVEETTLTDATDGDMEENITE